MRFYFKSYTVNFEFNFFPITTLLFAGLVVLMIAVQANVGTFALTHGFCPFQCFRCCRTNAIDASLGEQIITREAEETGFAPDLPIKIAESKHSHRSLPGVRTT